MPRPRNPTVFDVRDLTKVYHMGEVDVHALRAVTLALYESLPGVIALETRVVATVTLDIEGLEEILDGLAAGTDVVLHPPDTLADGMRVRPRA